MKDIAEFGNVYSSQLFDDLFNIVKKAKYQESAEVRKLMKQKIIDTKKCVKELREEMEKELREDVNNR